MNLAHTHRHRATDPAVSALLTAVLATNKGIVEVTTKRVIVFGYGQGIFSTKIEGPTLEVVRSAITDWRHQSGKATSLIGLAFDDESSIALKLPRLNQPDDFARAIASPFIEAIDT